MMLTIRWREWKIKMEKIVIFKGFLLSSFCRNLLLCARAVLEVILLKKICWQNMTLISSQRKVNSTDFSLILYYFLNHISLIAFCRRSQIFPYLFLHCVKNTFSKAVYVISSSRLWVIEHYNSFLVLFREWKHLLRCCGKTGENSLSIFIIDYSLVYKEKGYTTLIYYGSLKTSFISFR